MHLYKHTQVVFCFWSFVSVAMPDDMCQESMSLYAGLAAMLIVLAFSSAGSAIASLS